MCESFYIGEIDGFFHEVKVIRTKRGHKKEGDENEEILYGKVASLEWDPNW